MMQRPAVQAGKGEGYQGKHDFQDQALLNIYKKLYMGTHAKKPKMSIVTTNHLLIIQLTSKGVVIVCQNCKEYVSEVKNIS